MNDEFDAAQKAGNTTPLSIPILTFEHEGQMVTGRVLDVEPFTEGSFDSKCNKYIVQTDDGPVSFILGEATDKRLEGRVDKGALIRIVYRGKRDLKDGKTVNLFVVDVAEKGKAKA